MFIQFFWTLLFWQKCGMAWLYNLQHMPICTMGKMRIILLTNSRTSSIFHGPFLLLSYWNCIVVIIDFLFFPHKLILLCSILSIKGFVYDSSSFPRSLLSRHLLHDLWFLCSIYFHCVALCCQLFAISEKKIRDNLPEWTVCSWGLLSWLLLPYTTLYFK